MVGFQLTDLIWLTSFVSIPANLNVCIGKVIVGESEVAEVVEDKPVLTTGIACIELYTFGSVEQVKNFNL